MRRPTHGRSSAGNSASLARRAASPGWIGRRESNSRPSAWAASPSKWDLKLSNPDSSTAPRKARHRIVDVHYLAHELLCALRPAQAQCDRALLRWADQLERNEDAGGTCPAEIVTTATASVAIPAKKTNRLMFTSWPSLHDRLHRLPRCSYTAACKL